MAYSESPLRNSVRADPHLVEVDWKRSGVIVDREGHFGSTQGELFAGSRKDHVVHLA